MAIRTPEQSAFLKARWDEIQTRYRNAPTPQDHFAVGKEVMEIRREIREAGFTWPYAYTQPVEWGGHCPECEYTDGHHARNCEAVL